MKTVKILINFKIFLLAPQRPSTSGISTGVAQHLKIVPQNQFTTLKPQSGTQKFYTIESKQTGQKNYIAVAQRTPNRSQSTTPNNSRPPTPQTQYVANPRMSNVGKLPVMQQQTSFSPPKFTIVRQASSTPNTSYSTDTDISGTTNIFDMPVVFADSEGNIDEESSNVSDNSVIEIPNDPPATTTAKKVILKATNIGSFVNTASSPTVTITKNKNILIQKPSVPSKMLVLNGNVIGRSIPASNIVIPKATAPPQTMKFQKILTPGTSTIIPSSSMEIKKTVPNSKKIEIINNQIIKPAAAPTVTSAPKSMTFVNLADAKPLTTGRLSIPFSTVKGTGGQQIVIKTANLKQFTLSGNKQLGNLTVKKVNVVPSTVATTSNSEQPQQQQQKPKIIFKNAP